ncbi:MAG: hypothetical protein JWN03_5328 [Nocardia sp.]|uniref:DUF4234 domain-containing protein n=1 Tax=Nocardia sp. TaxID=1821 RepID=UPI002622EB13|nr:DUF4234 domain-containing protein [Nocardia sp.]MCU1645053.1 hypothetical protein [Nocardia sp.]
MNTALVASPIKSRNPVLVWLVWPLITLGIYFLVWYYKIHKEMAELRRDPDAPVAGPLLVMIFLSWTGIAAIISFWRTGTRIKESQQAAGLEGTCNPILGFLLNFVFGLGILYYQLELNKIADRFDR